MKGKITRSVDLLLVDEQALFRAGMVALLNQWGPLNNITQANNGIQALKEIESRTFGIVLLDLQLSGLDGFQTLKQIKNQRPKQKVIVLTARDNAAVVRKVYDLGAEGYLLKDSGYPELINALDKVVAGRSTLHRKRLILSGKRIFLMLTTKH